MRCVAYIGSMLAMEANLNITDDGGCHGTRLFPALRVAAGASAGALFAVLIALNMRAAHVMHIYEEAGLISHISPHVTVSTLRNMLDRYGLDPGNRRRSSLRHILDFALHGWPDSTATADTLTLGDLEVLTGVSVQCSVTCLGPVLSNTDSDRQWQSHVMFRSDTHPHTTVLDALSMSTCIPILFEPYVYDDMMYVDGSLVVNTPCDGMDPDTTLIVCLCHPACTSGFIGFVTNLILTATRWIESDSLSKFPHMIVVNCNVVQWTDFNAELYTLRIAMLEGMISTFRALRTCM